MELDPFDYRPDPNVAPSPLADPQAAQAYQAEIVRQDREKRRQQANAIEKANRNPVEVDPSYFEEKLAPTGSSTPVSMPTQGGGTPVPVPTQGGGTPAAIPQARVTIPGPPDRPVGIPAGTQAGGASSAAKPGLTPPTMDIKPDTPWTGQGGALDQAGAVVQDMAYVSPKEATTLFGKAKAAAKSFVDTVKLPGFGKEFLKEVEATTEPVLGGVRNWLADKIYQAAGGDSAGPDAVDNFVKEWAKEAVKEAPNAANTIQTVVQDVAAKAGAASAGNVEAIPADPNVKAALGIRESAGAASQAGRAVRSGPEWNDALFNRGAEYFVLGYNPRTGKPLTDQENIRFQNVIDARLVREGKELTDENRTQLVVDARQAYADSLPNQSVEAGGRRVGISPSGEITRTGPGFDRPDPSRPFQLTDAENLDEVIGRLTPRSRAFTGMSPERQQALLDQVTARQQASTRYRSGDSAGIAGPGRGRFAQAADFMPRENGGISGGIPGNQVFSSPDQNLDRIVRQYPKARDFEAKVAAPAFKAAQSSVSGYIDPTELGLIESTYGKNDWFSKFVDGTMDTTYRGIVNDAFATLGQYNPRLYREFRDEVDLIRKYRQNSDTARV